MVLWIKKAAKSVMFSEFKSLRGKNMSIIFDESSCSFLEKTWFFLFKRESRVLLQYVEYRRISEHWKRSGQITVRNLDFPTCPFWTPALPTSGLGSGFFKGQVPWKIARKWWKGKCRKVKFWWNLRKKKRQIGKCHKRGNSDYRRVSIRIGPSNCSSNVYNL